ncbi:ATP-dependent DNA helicase [Trichonephila clavipes]|nr:ATP-dependent DNA helicase [Trichonephila clavipes]
MTLHKSQGGTFDRIVYSYENSHQQHLVYVALSQVTSLKGLFIVSPTQDHVFYHGQKYSATTDPLRAELERLTLNPLRTNQQVLLDFIQDKLAILTLNFQSLGAHQADFDDVISQNCTILMSAETWFDNDEHISIPNFDCCVQFKRPGCRAAGVAFYLKQNNSHVVTPHMNIIYRQTNGLGIVVKGKVKIQPYGSSNPRNLKQTRTRARMFTGVVPVPKKGVHASCHSGAECHFVVWSSMLIVLVVPMMGRSVLAVDDTGVGCHPMIYHTCSIGDRSVGHVTLQQRCEGQSYPVGKLSLECC